MSYEIVRGAVVYSGHMAIDADGDPDAYVPEGGGHDALGNAGHDGDWFGVETDSAGKPIKQGPNDPHPGAYIPTTSLRDKAKAYSDPTCFVNAYAVRYASIPRELLHKPVGMGDFGMAIYGDVERSFVVADVGPTGKYGEGSEALGHDLGFKNWSPRNGGVNSGVTFVIFPGTALDPAWPVDPDEIDRIAREHYDAWKSQAS